MKKSKALIIPMLVIIIAIGFCFVLAFNYDKYKLDSRKFETTIELNGEVDLNELVIYDKITKRKFSVGEYSIVRCDDTSTVGKKVLIIEYKNQRYTINFTVKYKAEFI
ncbi:MAG: hypothetical protein J6Q15_00130, partial [Clostridia bacterium]|nr:hypothetical protein [Clostridia bacterium]